MVNAIPEVVLNMSGSELMILYGRGRRFYNIKNQSVGYDR